MKTIIISLCAVMLLTTVFIFTGCLAENDTTYNTIQCLAITANDSTEISKIVALSEEYGLVYSEKEYNKMGGGKETVYRFAQNGDVATQYRPSHGEYISINVDNETGKIYKYEYCNVDVLSTDNKMPYILLYFANTDQYYERGYYIINNAIHKLSDEYIELKYETAEEALYAMQNYKIE